MNILGNLLIPLAAAALATAGLHYGARSTSAPPIPPVSNADIPPVSPTDCAAASARLVALAAALVLLLLWGSAGRGAGLAVPALVGAGLVVGLWYARQRERSAVVSGPVLEPPAPRDTPPPVEGD